jgi:nucleoside-diphosphate-sugar epimerase
MDILITGGNGFIAKSLHTSLSSKYSIVSIGRYDFDLTDREATNNFFKHRLFDVVIHCAVSGVSRLKVDINSTLDNNLSMYYNLLANKSNFNKLIHFGSGAEIYCKDTTYGLSKHVIQQSLLEQENFYNIRIFAVFDENELDTRFIKSNIIRYINKEPIIIHQNKFMDFFYMKDLVSLVDYYIQNENPPKEIDCSYSESYTLFNIANMINNLNTHKVDIIFQQEGMNEKYCGEHNTILNYIGLEEGIKQVYDKLKK